MHAHIVDMRPFEKENRPVRIAEFLRVFFIYRRGDEGENGSGKGWLNAPVVMVSMLVGLRDDSCHGRDSCLCHLEEIFPRAL